MGAQGNDFILTVEELAARCPWTLIGLTATAVLADKALTLRGLLEDRAAAAHPGWWE